MEKSGQSVRDVRTKKKKEPITLKKDGSNFEKWFDAGCEGIEHLKPISTAEFDRRLKASKSKK